MKNAIVIDFSRLGANGEIALAAAIEEADRQFTIDAKKGDVIAKTASFALRNIRRQIKRQIPTFFD